MKIKSVFSIALVTVLGLSGPALAGKGGGGMGAGGPGYQAGGNAAMGQPMGRSGSADQALQRDRDREQYGGPGERDSAKAKAKGLGEQSGTAAGERTRQQDRVRDPAADD